MPKFWSDSIICSFELYMLYDFGKHLLLLNELRNSFRLVLNVSSLFIFLTINSNGSSILNLLTIPVLYMAFSMVNFGGTFLKKLCLGLCFYMMAVVPEFIFALLANIDSDVSYRLFHGNEFIVFITILLMKTMTFILVKCVEQFLGQKYYEEKQDRIFLALLVLPGATIILLSGLFYSDVHMASELAKYTVLIGAVLLLFSNAFMFYLFDKMLANMNRRQELEKLYLKSRVEKRYLDQIERSDEKRRSLLHDVNKYIRTAAFCVEEGNIDGAKHIFEKLDAKVQATKPIEYCRNKILNVVLEERKQAAEKKGIKFSVKIEFGVDFDFMDDVDIIAIMGNLLDNAYEAAVAQGKEGFIEIKAFTKNKGHFIIVNINNNFKIKPIQGKKGYLTRKPNKKEHGIGIHTVERIVKQYNGNLQINVNKEQKLFEVLVIFQV